MKSWKRVVRDFARQHEISHKKNQVLLCQRPDRKQSTGTRYRLSNSRKAYSLLTDHNRSW